MNQNIALAHAVSPGAVTDSLGVDPSRGLSQHEVLRRRAEYGENRLTEPAPMPGWRRLLRPFASPLVQLLLLAAAVAFALGEARDAVVVLVVVVLNAVLGAVQEGRADRALRSLRRLSTPRARVRRDGHELDLAAFELVPGDLIVLQSGDAVPADARLLSAVALETAEAALTGESTAVAKRIEAVAEDAPVADRHSMVYAGTHLTAGRALAVVVATGGATELGRIAALARTARPPKTPLEDRIDRFGRAVLLAAPVVFAVIVSIGRAREISWFDLVWVGVSQIVGMVPEGLPVAMTVALAVGVQRMAARRAIIRRLAAVETLGSITTICTDKTGTLTRNEMTATALWLPDGRFVEVCAAGLHARGTTGAAGEPIDGRDAALRDLLEAAVLCNDAAVVAEPARFDEAGHAFESPGSEPGAPRWRALGDPTEAALVVLARKAGLDVDALRSANPRHAERPFDSATKLMATWHAANGRWFVALKGAPEVVVPLCVPAASSPGRIDAAVATLTARALRVLAVARVEVDERESAHSFDALAGRARLLGFVGQIDPPRPGAADAVARCRAAGIRSVMLTGDHPATALAIARDLGIAGPGDRAIDGRTLAGLDEPGLAECLADVSVFARVSPEQKLRLVTATQRCGDVVAVTGDGVNDAPALMRADVGVAMGASGTEVARQAADVVLTDDDFATLVRAVEEGRVVHRNVQRALVLLLSTAVAEVSVLIGALAFALAPPFAAVQILWNNLVTEGVVTVNLVFEPAEGDEMRARPLPRSAPLLSPESLRNIGWLAFATALITLGWYAARLAQGVAADVVRTETFTLLAVCEWMNALGRRSRLRSIVRTSWRSNPWLITGIAGGLLLQIVVVQWPAAGAALHTVPLSFGQWVAIVLAGSGVALVDELRKWRARRSEQS